MQSCQVVVIRHWVITLTLGSLTWCWDAFIFISRVLFYLLWFIAQLSSLLYLLASVTLCHKASLSLSVFQPSKIHTDADLTLLSHTLEILRRIKNFEMILVVLTRHWLFAVCRDVDGWWLMLCYSFSLCHLSQCKKSASPICFHLWDLRLVPVIE